MKKSKQNFNTTHFDETRRKPKRNRISPYSPLASLDGRSKEAQLLRKIRTELIAHVGGNPSAVERALIERAAILSLRLAQLDAKIAAGTAFGRHDNDHYLAWSNGLGRTLARLGLKPASAAAPPSLDAYLAAKHRSGRAA